MAASSTIQLINTMEWAKKFNFNRSTAIGNYLEPALSSANTVLQTIIGPPFAWRWNRTVITPTCVQNQQDLAPTSVSLGWIETASVQDIATNANNKWYQMTTKIALAKDSSTGRPQFISAETDDGQGNITFRCMPTPNLAYPLSLTIQQKAALFTKTSQTWAPIPDEFSYIYNWGFLAMMWLFSDDPRFQIANQKFVAHLLGANQGLTETQINIFLNNWESITGQPVANMTRMQQGNAARGV